MRPYAVTRQLTGRPRSHEAFVRDAEDQRIVAFCPHPRKHRGIACAEKCAQRLLRGVVRQQKKGTR